MVTNVISTGETPRSLFSQDQIDILSRGDSEITILVEKINTENLANNQNGVTQSYWSLVRYLNEAINGAHSGFMENIKDIAMNNDTISSTQLLVGLSAHKEILEHYDYVKVQVIGWLVDHGIEVDRRKSIGVVMHSQDAVQGIIQAP